MSLKKSNEITVKIKGNLKEFYKIIESKNFKIVDKFSMNDSYFIPEKLKLSEMSTREILSNAILIRDIRDKISGEIVKKITFKIRTKVNGVDLLQEVIAENYDELTYYVSPRINKGIINEYSLYDKQTGIPVCRGGKNKQELINNYNESIEKCAQTRESKLYQTLIKEYEDLKKEELENDN